MLSRSSKFWRLEVFFFHDILKQKRKEFEKIGATQYKKYVAGKCTRVRAPLARKHTNQILESQGGTTSIKC